MSQVYRLKEQTIKYPEYNSAQRTYPPLIQHCFLLKPGVCFLNDLPVV